MTEGRGFFHQVMRGEIPPPKCSEILGTEILEHDSATGIVRSRFQGRETCTNPMGTVQGGFLAEMLDEAMAMALDATFSAGEFAPTVEMKINYVAAAKPGPLLGEGQVVHRGGSICFLEGSLRAEDGTLIATGSATAKRVKMK